MTKKVILISILCSVFFSVTEAQTTILLTDFSTDIPVNYTLINQDGLIPDASVAEYTDAWIRIRDTEDTNDWVAASTSFFSPSGTASRWLITPQLSLGANGNYINWNARSQDASFPDDYLVLLSHTGKNPTDFIDTIGYIQQEYVEWTNRTISLSDAGYNDSLVYIAFVNVTEDGFKLYLDDISVRKDDPLLVAEPNKVSIRVYPNPTTDFIHIETEALVQSTLYDSKGAQLLKSTAKKLEVSQLQEGIYILQLETSAGSICKKIHKY